MKKYMKAALVAAAALCASLGMAACGNGKGDGDGGSHRHKIAAEWSYDEYYHYHDADCGSVNHREDVAPHEGDECFCGYDADGGKEDPPDLGGESAFGAKLTSSGRLTFSDIEGACKYVLSVTYPGESAAEKYDIKRGKASVDLNKLRPAGFPSGKASVELTAYELYSEEIGGETVEQEIPMDVKESFRIVKLDGKYEMRLLAYSDEFVKLDGFTHSTEDDADIYTYEKALTDNKPTSFNVSDYAVAASGCEIKFYKTETGRDNDDPAAVLDRFSLNTVKINAGKNMFYARAASTGGQVKDYDLCVYGLASLTVKRYDLSFTTDADGLRTFTQQKIGEDISVVERDILTKEALYDGVESDKLARDSRYNIIEKSDLVVSADAADNYYDLYLYFYDGETVRADKAEYDEVSAVFDVTDGSYGISLRANADAKDAVTVPYLVCGKRVISAEFGSDFQQNTAITEVRFAEGFTAFVGKFSNCLGVTDIYLPSTITYMNDFAFGGEPLIGIKSIPDSATINCAFSAAHADSFASKWNYVKGTVSTRYVTKYDAEPEGGGTVTPGASAGLKYRLNNGELTVVEYVGSQFNGVIPDTAEYEGQTYPVTAIESFTMNSVLERGEFDNLVIGKNIRTIAIDAFDDWSRRKRPKSITVADGNTAFTVMDGVLYTADKTRVVFTANGNVFLLDTVTSIDQAAFGNGYNDDDRRERMKLYLKAASKDGIAFDFSGVSSDNLILGAYKATVGNFGFVVYTQGDGWRYGLEDKPFAEIIAYGGNGGKVVIPAEVDGVPVSVIADSFLTVPTEEYGLFVDHEVTDISVPFSLLDYYENRGFKALFGLNGGMDSVTRLTLTGDADSMSSGYRLTENLGLLTELVDIMIDGAGKFMAKDKIVYQRASGKSGDGELEILYILPTISGAVTIADGVTMLDGYGKYTSFSGKAITSVVIPASVKSIFGSFGDCASLVSVTLSEGLEEIGYGAFKNCSALAKVTIPSTVTKIDSNAFWGCISLSEVNLTNIEANTLIRDNYGNCAFSYCYKLKTVNYAGTKAQFGAVQESIINNGSYGVFSRSYVTTVKCSDGDYKVQTT